MILKIVFGQDTRRIRVADPAALTFEALGRIITENFSLEPKDVSIRYLDDEADMITVSSDFDLVEAIELANARNINLRLEITTKKVNEAPPCSTGRAHRAHWQNPYYQGNTVEWTLDFPNENVPRLVQAIRRVSANPAHKDQVEATLVEFVRRMEGIDHESSDAPIVHYGVTCDHCKDAPIIGVRHKCTVCPDYDLCEACLKVQETDRLHDPSHTFNAIVTPVRGRFGCGRRRQAFNMFHGASSATNAARTTYKVPCFGDAARVPTECAQHNAAESSSSAVEESKPYPAMVPPAPASVSSSPQPNSTASPYASAPQAPVNVFGTSAVFHHLTNPPLSPIATSQPMLARNLNATFAHLGGSEGVAPGGTYQQSFEIKNTGTISWPTPLNLHLVNDGGQRAAPNTIAISGAEPGATTQVNVSFTAPSTPGSYTLLYRLMAPSGEFFGAGLELKVNVTAPFAQPHAQQPSPQIPANYNREAWAKAQTLCTMGFTDVNRNYELILKYKTIEAVIDRM